MAVRVFARAGWVAVGLSALLASAPASGQVFSVPDSQEVITATGGFGLAYFAANELVYSGGSKLSHLIWDGYAPVASGSLSSRFNRGWHLSVSGSVGMGGDHSMTDYDWIAPWATGTGFDDWSHRSQHPDTRLDHFVSASLRTGYHVMQSGSFRGGWHVEANYTDVQWTAYGGTYLYSTGGFRNDPGTIPAGSAAITYRQYLPMLMAGVDFESEAGDWTFSGAAQGGLTLFAAAVDEHWLRDRTYTDNFYPAPVLAAEMRADYAFSSDAGFFAALSAKKVFEAIGDTTLNDAGVVSYYSGAAGTDFLSATVSAGFSGKF